MNTYINKQAFLTMVLSGVAVYKKETLGLLIGKKHNLYYVQFALPYQEAKRKIDMVVEDTKEDRKIKRIISDSDLEIIGEFHSHPSWRGAEADADVSKDGDLERMAEVDYDIGIVFLIEKTKKQYKWKHNKNGGICGSIGNYYIDMNSFFYDKEQPEGWDFSRIICPYALSL